jgi:chromosome segregation ATPase
MSEMGSNNPPLKDQLELRYAELFQRMLELIEAAKTVPPKLESDAEAGAAQDLVKMMRVALKNADGAREIEKEPFADAVKVVNATFKKPMEALDGVMRDIMSRTTDFMDRKKEAERLRLAEIARKEREEAERKAREAAEAEQRKRDAEAAEAKAKAEAAEAERRAAAAKAEAAAAEQRAKEAKEANDREEARQAALKAKSEADRARIAKVEADAAAREAKEEAREANREAVMSTGDALRAEKRAERIDAKAEDAAALSRTRGDLGTVGSLAKRWTYRVINYNDIPMEMIKPFIAHDAIDAAIWRAMQTGVRSIPGVVIEQVEEARIA